MTNDTMTDVEIRYWTMAYDRILDHQGGKCIFCGQWLRLADERGFIAEPGSNVPCALAHRACIELWPDYSGLCAS